MDKPSTHASEMPALDGPDYVALVIEWDRTADQIEHELDGQLTDRIVRPRGRRTIAIAAGALGVLALAVWGIRRVRAR